MAQTIILLLKGTQSWGVGSKYETRTTEREPTKSGVIGLVANALGYRRTDDISDLVEMRFGVRVDKEGKKRWEYQIVGSNSDSPKQTYREYLSDAVFLVGLESEDLSLIRKIDAALQEPARPLFMGRKKYFMHPGFYLGIHDGSIEDVFRSIKDQSGEGKERFRVLMDALSSKDGNVCITHDTPITFDADHRQYGSRLVQECYANVNAATC